MADCLLVVVAAPFVQTLPQREVNGRDCVMVLFVGQFGTTSASFFTKEKALDIVDVVPVLPTD